ncbi:MAG: protein phosphatase 2C domain-containing protein [Steroidobacteraceae bacterium]
MQLESAQISLLGDRDDNQDRVTIIKSEQATLLVVLDGMGGHADGSRAADTALKSLSEAFNRQSHPIFDPLGFVHMALSRAHDEVVRLGIEQSLELRPRATVVLCLVQDGASYWGHVGDSRIYHLRHNSILDRTRDHSHVELLLREGRITEAEIPGHPMRNFVECCLGGDAAVPEMTISGRKLLQPGDVLLLCSDGIWAGLRDEDIATFPRSAPTNLQGALEMLGKRAVRASAPHSDNSTAAALRCLPN